MPDDNSITRTDSAAPARQDGEAPTDGSLDRLVDDTKSLTDDVAEWLRLKVQLIQLEVHERITEEVNAILSSVLVLGLILVAVLLAMMSLGFFVGQLIDSVWLGFATASLLIVVISVLLGRTQPQWIGSVMYSLVPRRWLNVLKTKDGQSREDQT